MDYLYNEDFNTYLDHPEIPLHSAKLILTDIPYNIGKDAYASNPQWWKNGNIKDGPSIKANSEFFDNDINFDLDNFLKFCSDMIEDNGSCIIFCSYIQCYKIIEKMGSYGFKHYIPLVFIKNNSAEVLKVNMRIVGACEYGLQIYKNKLPEFKNNKKMIKNWFNFERIQKKLHPNEKPSNLIREFIELFTNENDLVVDPCFGSGVVYKEAKKKAIDVL